MVELGGLLLLGFSYGGTLCAITCLPYLSPFLLATGDGFRDGLRSSMLFLFGKLMVYTLLGGLAAYLGKGLELDKVEASKYIMGVTLFAVGFFIVFFHKSECQNKAVKRKKTSALFLGVCTSMTPCPALMVVFALAVQKGSILSGLTYGAVYGFGVAISPLLLIGAGLSAIGGRMKTEVGGFMPYLRVASGFLVVMAGVRFIVY